MKTENKIVLCDWAINIVFALTVFIVPLFFSTKLYNSFRLPKNTLFMVLAVAAIFFSLMRVLEKKSFDWRRHKLILILTGVFFILNLLSWLFSAQPFVSFWGEYFRAEGFLLWILIIGFFLAALFNDWTKGKRKTLALIIVFSAICLSGYGIMQRYGLIANHWTADVEARIISSMGNPLNFSAYIILLFPFFYYCFVNFKNTFLRILIICGLVLSAVSLYLSGSRSSWIAFLFANFAIFTFYFYKRHKKIFAALLLTGIAAISIFTFMGIKYFDRFEQPGLKRIFSVFDPADESNQQRLLFWRGSFDAFLERPIFGWGQDSLGYAFDKNYPPALSDLSETHIDRAHNWHLDVLVMNGAPTWLLLMFVLIFAFAKSIKLSKNEQTEKSWLGLTFIYLMAACLLQFFFMFALISPVILICLSLAMVFNASFSPSAQGAPITSSLLEKLKKNSNLYFVLGLGSVALVFFVILKPILANKELSAGLFSQKDMSRHFQLATEIFPHPFYRQQYGALYVNAIESAQKRGDLESMNKYAGPAKIIFPALIDEYPYYYQNYLLLAKTLSLTKDQDAARVEYELAIENFPARQDIYWQYAEYLFKQNENDAAISVLEQAIAIDEEVGMPYLKLSLAYLALGEKEKAAAYEATARSKGLREKFFKKEENKINNSTSSSESASPDMQYEQN
ncbi:MAG TPA: O-antigen ligase family protein [Candidatus Bipolaricaulota bacterium]|nr:O-antigen ligase family protein [Candidatus Bipolaricaulota bacterium]